MKSFEIQLHHDNGQAIVIVTAEDESAARAMVMNVEKCPARSITSIKEAS